MEFFNSFLEAYHSNQIGIVHDLPLSTMDNSQEVFR